MTKSNNNKTEQNISIAILCATLWIVLAGYLASFPVDAKPLTDIESFALCNLVEDEE